jgi:class III poly(R)-hydroxyalkanoic acid synthase PhaE subunit
MKTANPIIDSIVETQTNFINNWVESAKKVQSAFSNGNIAGEGQSIYKEFLDKQMNILNSMKDSTANLFDANKGSNDPQEFFKSWFNQQAGYAKQMADFNQSIYSSVSNFGKPAQDYLSNFGQSNTAFTNIYNSWINTLNTSYDTLSKNMSGTFNKDVFTNFFQGNQINAKMQEFFQPMSEAIQKGQFNFEAFKNYFTADSYQNLTKQIFGSLYNGAPIKEVYDNGIKQIQGFFTGQQNLSKEYYAQIQNVQKEFPQLFSGNFDKVKELYSQVNDVFGKTFEPLLKVASPGKEKEAVEATITLLDKLATYSIKQAELQSALQATTQKSLEKVAKQFTDKYSDLNSVKQLPSAQDLYNEWIKVNEQLFTELFASEDFSKIKGEALNLSMDVKKQFQSQFENAFENFPLVFKSEVEELHKTIYDLKKQVKELQSKLGTPTDDKKSKK